MGETLEEVFSQLSRKPKELLTELKELWLRTSRNELPPTFLAHGLTSKLMTGLQGHLVRELKRKNSEYVYFLVRSFHSALKHHVDGMDADPDPVVLGRASEMIVHAFNTLSHEPSVDEQWVDIINLLASSASLLAVYQPYGLGDCMPVLMELSQDQKLQVECRVKVCNAINEVWEVYSTAIKEQMEARGVLKDHCKRWLVSLGKAGDYELQLQLLEAVFRVSDAKQRDLLCKMCFKDQQLAAELKSINPKELDVGSRRFLNFLNTREGAEASVLSVPCLWYQFGDMQLPQPSELDQFWIDFNLGGQSMSTYIEDSWEGSASSSTEEAPWISVVVKSTDIASYKLQAATDTIVLVLTLKQAAGTLIPSCPINNDSTLLRLSFHGAHYDQLSWSLEKVFGCVSLVSPSLTLSTTTEVAPVQKRKVSQAPVHVLISSKRNYTPVCVVNKLQTPTTADKAPFCSRTPAPEKASMQTRLPSNRTAAATDTVINDTRVSGDKEGKAPSVPVSPIYSSPIKSTKFVGTSANLNTTPRDCHIPTCTPKTSTPRKQTHITALRHAKDGHAGEARLRKRGQPPQQLADTGATPSKHKKVESSRKKITPLNVRGGKVPMQGSKGSTSQTKSPEHPSDGNDCSSSEGVAEPPPQRAETHSREPRLREKGVTDQVAQPTSRAKATADKRPALENITNVARNMGKRTSPPRKAKAAKGVTPLEAALESNPAPSEVNIDLDVIQDSIPQGKKSKTAKQKAAKPRYPKEKHQGLHKKPTPPAPVLSRSLLHNLSANTSKGSLAMDKDPYAFDSEDEVPDLPLTVSKGRKIPGRKWHEEEEEEKLPRVREKKRVYSNKGKAQLSFCLSVDEDSPTMSVNDCLKTTPPPVRSHHMDKTGVTSKEANISLHTRHNSMSCAHEPQKKPKVARARKRIRAHPSCSAQSEDSFNSHCNESSDESYLPRGKETPRNARHEQQCSGSSGRPQRSCRRSSEQSNKDSDVQVQPTTPAGSEGASLDSGPGSSAVVQPSIKSTPARKKTTLDVPASRKRKTEELVQVPRRQVHKGGKKGEPLHRGLKGNGHRGFQPVQATLLQVQEREMEESPSPSSCKESEALEKENASPPGVGGFDDEGISEVVASLPYHTRPKNRDKLTGIVSEQCAYGVGSSLITPIGLKGEGKRKHSGALQASSPPAEDADNSMEGSGPEEGEGDKHDVRELTLEFAAICKDVIAHSGDKGKKGAAPTTKAAAKQKGRKRAVQSKDEATSSKRRKDETPALYRPRQGRTQPAKRAPRPHLATPGTIYDKSGIGSCKWQTHHSHQSGRQGREKEFQTTGLSPVQPIHFPSLESHSTYGSPCEDSEDDIPSQPGINTQVQQTLEPLAAVMKAKSASYQGGAHQVAQNACRSTEKHTAHFWRLQSDKWRALRQRFSTDMLSLVSGMEEDVLGTCQAAENMQKLMCAFDSEHKTLMDSLTSQNERLSELSGVHHNLKKQWSASERDVSKKTAVLEGNLQKEVEHITKETMAKSRQEQMDKIRRSVQTWLLLNM